MSGVDAADLIPIGRGSRLDFTCVTQLCHVLVNRKQSQKDALHHPLEEMWYGGGFLFIFVGQTSSVKIEFDN